MLRVRVRDDGVGLPEGKVGSGLGTQIVRTLIEGELGGTIDWHTLEGEGTEVTIDIPLLWMTERVIASVVSIRRRAATRPRRARKRGGRERRGA